MTTQQRLNHLTTALDRGAFICNSNNTALMRVSYQSNSVNN